LATPPLCCAAQRMTTIGQNQNSARNERLRRAGGSYANAFGTATLVTSNLLILAASNVLFPSSLSSLSDSHIAPRYHPFGPLRISRNTQLRPLCSFGENEI
ncbi:MAG: hypothetical protein ACK5KS_20870, partial [Planctomyces sp.]